MWRMAGAVARNSPLPLYFQLKQLILESIRREGLGPGDRLPGEFELCEHYGVSRTVVRQALRELEFEGAIERERGRGTFVAPERSSEGIGQSLLGRFEQVHSSRGNRETLVLRLERVPASDLVATDLGLPLGTLVVEIDRLRVVDGSPWAFTITQLIESVGGQLTPNELANESIYGVLEGRHGVRFASGHRTIEAAAASPSLAQVLKVRIGSPLLVLRGVGLDEAGVPIERFTAFHRGDVARFDVSVVRD